MCTLSSVLLKAAVSSISCVALLLPAEALPESARAVSPNQLTTPVERAEFCSQMRNAATQAERQAVAQRWHELVTARAKEQGVESRQGMGDHQPMMGYDGGMPMGMGMSRTCSQTGNSAGRSGSSGAAEPPVDENQGIAYVTGGVGVEEAAAMRAVAPRYSMRARFFTSAGEFVSDVTVRVYRADGRLIFTAISDGPYLYAQVPPGRYRLLAKLDGIERPRTVDIPRRGGITISLTWPAARVTAGS